MPLSPEQIAAAYEQHAPAIERFLLQRTSDPHQVEDLLQIVFLEALQRAASYEDRGHPISAWLYRIAYSRLIDARRQAARRRAESYDHTPDLAGECAPPDDAVLSRLHCEELLGAAGLTAEQRRVVELRFFCGLSLDETAAAIRRSHGAAKALQHRALDKLNAARLDGRPRCACGGVVYARGECNVCRMRRQRREQPKSRPRLDEE